MPGSVASTLCRPERPRSAEKAVGREMRMRTCKLRVYRSEAVRIERQA